MKESLIYQTDERGFPHSYRVYENITRPDGKSNEIVGITETTHDQDVLGDTGYGVQATNKAFWDRISAETRKETSEATSQPLREVEEKGLDTKV